jgi:hypothetical protein
MRSNAAHQGTAQTATTFRKTHQNEKPSYGLLQKAGGATSLEYRSGGSMTVCLNADS